MLRCSLTTQVADMKLKGPSFETLTASAEVVGPQFMTTMLHKKAVAHKNPKVRGGGGAVQWAGLVGAGTQGARGAHALG